MCRPVVSFSLFLFLFATSQIQAIDLDSDNAATQLVIPNAVPAIFEVSPTGGDATLVLRFTTLITTTWFDASAPYHETAVGVYSQIERRPSAEATYRNINTAVIYASYRIFLSLFPEREQQWRTMLLAEGLDPDDNSTDITTAIGIGNTAGNAVVVARENDGMNQLGNEDYNKQPYGDYTGFMPANSAYELTDPSKWQPDIVSDRKGIFRVQQFVTPQLRYVTPYSYTSPSVFRVEYPTASQVRNIEEYKEQADAVLDASANMTDEQKMLAELFDNKILSLGVSGVFAAQTKGIGLIDTLHYEFLTNVAAFDTAIAVWNEKARFNAVRPFSAIEYLYGDSPVTAWGGPGVGTVSDLPADEWRSYLQTADHPEYPSATASFCAAHAEVSRLFFGDDSLNFNIPVDAGSSLREPGVTPSQAMMLEFPTWSDLDQKCGDSRFWAGVHFYPSIPAGRKLGRTIAAVVYDFVTKKIAGETIATEVKPIDENVVNDIDEAIENYRSNTGRRARWFQNYRSLNRRL